MLQGSVVSGTQSTVLLRGCCEADEFWSLYLVEKSDEGGKSEKKNLKNEEHENVVKNN